MYDKLLKNMTPKIRLMVALVLFLVGIMFQILSDKALDQQAFYLMAAAVLCVASVILEKASKSEHDFFLFMILNMAVLIVGFALAGEDGMTTTVRYASIAICVLLDWVFHAFLIRCDSVFRRIVLGLAATVMNVVLVGIVFMIPVLLAAFAG